MPKKAIYIPAGMNMGSYRQKSLKSTTPTISTKVIINKPSGQSAAKASTSKDVLSPPKTICKNKSLNIDNYRFHVNDNAVLSTDVKNLPDLNLNINNKIKTPTLNQLETALPTHTGGNQSTGAVPKTTNTVSINVTKLKSDEKLVEPVDLKTGTPMKINFKDMISKRLKNAKKKQSEKSYQQPRAECDCANCDSFLNCAAWCSNNICFNKSVQPKKVFPLLKNNNSGNPPAIETKTDNKIVLQGVLIPKQKFALDETCICEVIQKMLKEMNCTSAKHIQTYMWTAVQRGLSTFMISPPESGKTLSYLPIFSTFCEEKKDRYTELAKYEGPLVIILCLNNEGCYEVQNLTKTIISHCSNVVMDVSTEVITAPNCDILITTPPILKQNVKLGFVSLKRLCHIAIENAHLALRTYNECMENLFKVINAMSGCRPHHKNIQVVVASEKWSVDLETLLKKLYMPPLVCFEDFLEAAVYAKVEFKKKTIKSAHKIFYLVDILKGHYITTKTVVFCEEEEMSKIQEKLEISGVECISISNSLSEDEMFINEETWNSLRIGQYKVLLCTDSTYEKTAHVLDAKWLVHYSLPKDWPHFQKRFRCFSKNIQSPLNVEGTGHQAKFMLNYMIIEEVCSNQLCLDFFEILLRNSVKYLRL